MRSIIFKRLILIGIGLVLYLSWLPQPKLGLLWFIPDWLANWTDAVENDALRTAVPFVALGVVFGWYSIQKGYIGSQWLAGWLLLVSVVIIAEAGQLLLPHRSFDWMDVAWGAVGALIGISLMMISKQLKSLFINNR